MLNKLHYFKQSSEHPVAQEEKNAIKEQFVSYFRQKGKELSLSALDGGTLGVVYRCEGLTSAPVFVKTHLLGKKYQNTLEKEYFIFKSIYDDTLYCDRISIQMENGAERTFLLMDWLCPIQEMSIENILKIIGQFGKIDQSKLEAFDMYDIAELLAEAKSALLEMAAKGFYSLQIAQRAESALWDLEQYLLTAPRVLCHGDLSDKNIMLDPQQASIALDWEDAFWGIEGYDYLYWLTFFNHRKYYSMKNVFSLSSLPREIVTGVLIMILLVKNAISYHSGDYVNNTLSMEKRLEEILICTGRAL